MKRNSVFILCFVLVTVLVSCSDDDGETRPDPINASDIQGAVILYDDLTNQLANDGMTVSIEGSNPLISDLTDDDGDFVLSQVTFGTYTLEYRKSGYGTFKRFGLAHNNPAVTNITNIPSLGQVSTTEISDLSVTVSGEDVVFDFSTTPAANNSNPRYIRLFYHDESTVSSTVFTSFSEVIEIRSDFDQVTVNIASLSGSGFQSGTTVYVRVYGDAFFSNAYDDPNLGRRIFPNLNEIASNEVSFMFP